MVAAKSNHRFALICFMTLSLVEEPYYFPAVLTRH